MSLENHPTAANKRVYPQCRKKKLWRMVCYSTKHFTKSFIIVFNVLCFLVSRYLHSDLKIITKSSNIYSRLLKYLHLNYGTPTMINTALCGALSQMKKLKRQLPTQMQLHVPMHMASPENPPHFLIFPSSKTSVSAPHDSYKIM